MIPGTSVSELENKDEACSFVCFAFSFLVLSASIFAVETPSVEGTRTVEL